MPKSQIFNELLFNDSYLNPAINDLKETLGNEAVINIEIVTGIPTLASGKRKPVVNEWKQKEN